MRLGIDIIFLGDSIIFLYIVQKLGHVFQKSEICGALVYCPNVRFASVPFSLKSRRKDLRYLIDLITDVPLYMVARVIWRRLPEICKSV